MKLEKEVYIDKISQLGNMNVCFYEPFTLEEIETLKKIAIKRKVKLTLEIQEPILDDEEKRYLSGVIRPFRDRVEYIKKLNEHYIGDEYILIKTNSNSTPLPYFKKGTMYKGMELDKEYSLKDLGL